jgi:hypothetical protein
VSAERADACALLGTVIEANTRGAATLGALAYERTASRSQFAAGAMKSRRLKHLSGAPESEPGKCLGPAQRHLIMLNTMENKIDRCDMGKIPVPRLRWPKNNAQRKAAIDAIVEWLAAEIERRGYLNHDAAARGVIGVVDGLGLQWWSVCDRQESYDKRGRPAGCVFRLHSDVLRAFKKRTGKTVIWEKDARAWRKRKSPA